MSNSWLNKSPSYHQHYASTIRLEEDDQGNVTGRILNLYTGAFDEATPEQIDDVLGSRGNMDFRELTEDAFILETERERRRRLRGDGTIFAIYDVIDALYGTAKDEGRKVTREEAALIVGLYRRTFPLWEEEFARQAAGEPPSFSYTSLTPPPESL